MNGWVFSILTSPCVALRICAMTLRDLILYCFTHLRWGKDWLFDYHEKYVHLVLQKKATPKPSEWQSVKPARRRKPSKEKNNIRRRITIHSE